MQKLFFSILRDSLWREGEMTLPQKLSEKEAREVSALAEKQTVSGLVIDALFRHEVKMPQMMIYEAIGQHGQIKQQSRAANKGVVELNNLFASSGVDYVVVKGQVVASYYPDALLRQSGDIDYYCDNANFEKAQRAVADRWGIAPETERSEKHAHFENNGITYEGHFALLTLYGKKERDYWQQLLKNDKDGVVIIDSVEVRTLSPTVHVLYVFLHLYNHLMKLGVGLRQFCDLAVMLHYAKEQIDMVVLRGHLRALGMERAYRACGSILVDYIGLSESDLGYTLTDTDRKYGKRILSVVMYRGNMGHHNKFGGFHGWKHKVGALGIKLSHFAKFAPLAPNYSCGWLCHEIKRHLN